MNDRVSTRPALRRRPSTPLAELAYEAVAEAIFDGKLTPGEKLGIDSLAAELQMSITPVREALSRLQAQRLILSHQNRGFTVAAALTATEFHRLFQARRVLEHGGLDEALPPAGEWTPAPLDVAEAAERLRATQAAGTGPGYHGFATFAWADMRFHEHLVGLSGNIFLVDAWRGLNFHLHVSRLYGQSGVIDMDAAGAEHDEIFRALEHGDRPGFLAAVRGHIDRAETRLDVLVR